MDKLEYMLDELLKTVSIDDLNEELKDNTIEELKKDPLKFFELLLDKGKMDTINSYIYMMYEYYIEEKKKDKEFKKYKCGKCKSEIKIKTSRKQFYNCHVVCGSNNILERIDRKELYFCPFCGYQTTFIGNLEEIKFLKNIKEVEVI